MIPFVIVPALHLGPLTLQPFGILVAIGVLVGMSLASRRARLMGLDEKEFQSFVAWILVVGFVAAHLLDSFLYHPREVWTSPWTLLTFWAGLSSFGGFIGAALGALGWKYFVMREWFAMGTGLTAVRPVRRATPARLLPFADVVMAVFPVAWIFGRAGCSVVHDHPGARAPAGALLSVAYGPGASTDYHLFQLRHGVTPRYDLGLLEMLFAAFLAVAFATTWKRGGASGRYVAAACVAYAPVRFALDFLRLDDAEGGDRRYASLTPAQWACIVLLVFGAWLALSIRRNEPAPIRAVASESDPARSIP